MKIKMNGFVKVIEGNPLNIYEVIAIRRYKDDVLVSIWGVNTQEAGVIDAGKLKVVTPYWDENEELPFHVIDEFVLDAPKNAIEVL